MVRPWDQWLIALIAPEAAGVPSPSAEDIMKRIHEIIGDPAIPVKVLSTSWWTINDVVAEKYSVGRVFCMGDAVHRHPPTNGLGSNTCVQDSFNLAWKLALVLQGKAAPGLLDSFNAERQPVGRQIVARANKSMVQNQRLWDLFGGGLRSVLSAEDHAAVFDTPGGRATLREMLDLMQYEYHAHGVEMNRHYVSQAIVDDDSAIPFDYKRDPELYYQPSTRPGSFLPHVWLGKRAAGPRISTLDVAGKRRFTLFTGHGGDAWRDAAALASKQLGVEINVTSIGPYLDFEDTYGGWRRLSGIDESGCVLVRPDLHVGWRSARIIDNPNAVLVDVMRTILALRPRQDA